MRPKHDLYNGRWNDPFGRANTQWRPEEWRAIVRAYDGRDPALLQIRAWEAEHPTKRPKFKMVWLTYALMEREGRRPT